MKIHRMELISSRLDAIKSKSKELRDKQGNITQLGYKKLKLLVRGNYKPSLGIVPVIRSNKEVYKRLQLKHRHSYKYNINPGTMLLARDAQ